MNTVLRYLNPYGKVNLRIELLAGLTVAMTMIPESLSFAILAGLSPLMGLYAAFIMGLVAAVLGGRPGMISGGAGATIVTLMALISLHGVEYLLATVIVGGILQFLVGAFKFGKFIRLIPQPVMFGFLNGLAVLIFMSQVAQFKLVDAAGVSHWLTGTAAYTMLGLTVFAAAMVYVFPKITKAIPASLVAILATFALVYAFNIDTKTVGDLASIKGNLPVFHIPTVPFTWHTLTIVFPFALVMASVGLIESLLTLSMVDELTNTKGNTNREAMAQGAANLVNGFFGGMGGCAMVAQTLVNINAGSRSRLSGIIGALTILLIIVVASPLIEQIPMAALVGVMMVVAIGTFQWISFGMFRKMPKADLAVMVLVTLITIVLHDLALAVLVGVVLSALVFAWENAKRIRARKTVDADGTKVYEIYGPLFFGSVAGFLEKFDIQDDPALVIIDFKESKIADMSAIDAVNKLAERYQQQNKRICLRHLSPDCKAILQKAESLVHIEVSKTDPTYNVMP